MKRFTLSVVMTLFAAPALAQELDCNNALTQSDMNQCAYQGWQYADGDLNATYRLAVSWAKETDASLPDDLKGAEAALREGQRAWITVRDKTCELAGFVARGGSMEPSLVYACMEDLTRARSEELRSLTEMN